MSGRILSMSRKLELQIDPLVYCSLHYEAFLECCVYWLHKVRPKATVAHSRGCSSLSAILKYRSEQVRNKRQIKYKVPMHRLCGRPCHLSSPGKIEKCKLEISRANFRPQNE
jgi:hypothetical protein